MSGSTAEVLLPKPLTEKQLARLQNLIQSIASEVAGQSFWVGGQPFSWSESDDQELAPSHASIGWSPAACLIFCAMCRGTVSDAFLAMVVAKVAQELGGLIAFGGHIHTYTADKFVLTLEGRYECQDQDVVTPQFMHQWLSHPSFQMVN